jgi:hypothetical protein
VDGKAEYSVAAGWLMWRRGDDGRCKRAAALLGGPRPGEVLRSWWWSRTDDRTGDTGGKDSSTDLRGGRIRWGEPRGLSGRAWGRKRMWPEPETPGKDWVRDMAGGRLAVERDRECEPASGEVVRGR